MGKKKPSSNTVCWRPWVLHALGSFFVCWSGSWPTHIKTVFSYTHHMRIIWMLCGWLGGNLAKWAARTEVFRVQAPEQEFLNRKLEEVLVIVLPIKKLWKLKKVSIIKIINNKTPKFPSTMLEKRHKYFCYFLYRKYYKITVIWKAK